MNTAVMNNAEKSDNPLHSCCGPEWRRLCNEGEGDCDTDDQCSGNLECGTNNCAVKTGGYWDGEDDCCQRRCSADRPCGQGKGESHHDESNCEMLLSS